MLGQERPAAARVGRQGEGFGMAFDDDGAPWREDVGQDTASAVGKRRRRVLLEAFTVRRRDFCGGDESLGDGVEERRDPVRLAQRQAQESRSERGATLSPLVPELGGGFGIGELLEGEGGRAVHCTIYAHRPGPCHELEAGSDACNRARRRHGLAAILDPP